MTQLFVLGIVGTSTIYVGFICFLLWRLRSSPTKWVTLIYVTLFSYGVLVRVTQLDQVLDSLYGNLAYVLELICITLGFLFVYLAVGAVMKRKQITAIMVVGGLAVCLYLITVLMPAVRFAEVTDYFYLYQNRRAVLGIWCVSLYATIVCFILTINNIKLLRRENDSTHLSRYCNALLCIGMTALTTLLSFGWSTSTHFFGHAAEGFVRFIELSMNGTILLTLAFWIIFFLPNRLHTWAGGKIKTKILEKRINKVHQILDWMGGIIPDPALSEGDLEFYLQGLIISVVDEFDFNYAEDEEAKRKIGPILSMEPEEQILHLMSLKLPRR